MASLEARILSHPLRVKILEEITAGPTTRQELADLIGAALAIVCYHTRILCHAECIRPVEATATDSTAALYEISV